MGTQEPAAWVDSSDAVTGMNVTMQVASVSNSSLSLLSKPSPLVKFGQHKPAQNIASPTVASGSGVAGLANPTTLSWVSGRPANEKTASTGSVSPGDTSTSQVQVKLSLKKSGAYTFQAGYSYGYTGKAPTVSMSLTDAAGKVVKTATGATLTLSRSETDKLSDGDYIVTLKLTPKSGGTAYFSQYNLQASQKLSPIPSTSKDTNMDAILAGGAYWWHPEGTVAAQTTTPVTSKVNQLSLSLIHI